MVTDDLYSHPQVKYIKRKELLDIEEFETFYEKGYHVRQPLLPKDKNDDYYYYNLNEALLSA